MPEDLVDERTQVQDTGATQVDPVPAPSTPQGGQSGKTMQIVLIRHGTKGRKPREAALQCDCEWNEERPKKEELERNTPLAEEQAEIEELADALVRLGIEPRFDLTSKYLHARETAERLKEETAKRVRSRGGVPYQAANQIIELCALTPFSTTETLSQVIQEAGNVGANLEEAGVIAIVGHHPRVDKLLEEMVSIPNIITIEYGKAVHITADSLADLKAGKGIVAPSFPVELEEEEQAMRERRVDALRDKLTTKITVSTVLAGFTFTALIETLNAFEKLSDVTVFAALAVWFLVAALALFVVAIYTYDELLMPVEFWRNGGDGFRPKWGRSKYDSNQEKQGELYAHMVWAWKWMFTPGVWCGICGIILIVLHRLVPEVHFGALFFDRFSTLWIVVARTAWLVVIVAILALGVLYARTAKPAFTGED